jgi:phage replication initiation protein
MKNHDARITRVDLCLDLLAGEYDLSVALNAWKHGLFQNGPGRKPTISQLGNWIEPDGKGRTLYIGSRASGKMWRIYEKGKQLGDALSKWVRWELELRNERRDIPHDVVTKCAEYLVGAAPVMARIVKAAAEKIRAVRVEGTIMLDHVMNHCRKSYGKLIQYLRLSGASPEDVLISLSRPLGDRLPRWGVQAALAPVDHIRGLALFNR